MNKSEDRINKLFEDLKREIRKYFRDLDGNVNKKIEVNSNDELKELKKEFKECKKELRKEIRNDIKQNVEDFENKLDKTLIDIPILTKTNRRTIPPSGTRYTTIRRFDGKKMRVIAL